MTSVALATEDELSEAVGQRLLAEATHRLYPNLLLRRGGAGHLRSGMDKWCALAKHQPLLLLTDLDLQPCASALIEAWLGKRRQPKNFVLRVAVREVEAWLLADHKAMQSLLGHRGALPSDPDALRDPKRRLLQLARSARREIRDDLVARKGAAAAQGIAYNARLSEFVATEWNPQRASIRSQSLCRARLRIDELARRLRAE